MHPGPMNRGLEISSAAADSPRSTVLAQVRNGVSIRMAALYLLLSGDTREPAGRSNTHSTPAETTSAHATKESH
jgi:aspartate carbamoyltransferase catalytic subunit